MMRHLLSMALCLCLLIPVSTSKAQEKPADTGDLSAAVEFLRTVEKTNIHYVELSQLPVISANDPRYAEVDLSAIPPEQIYPPLSYVLTNFPFSPSLATPLFCQMAKDPQVIADSEPLLLLRIAPIDSGLTRIRFPDEREEIVSVIEYLVLLKNGTLLESPDDYIITYDAAKNPVARFGYYDLLRLNKKYHFTSPEIYDIISSSPAHQFAKGSREYRYAQHLYHIMPNSIEYPMVFKNYYDPSRHKFFS